MLLVVLATFPLVTFITELGATAPPRSSAEDQARTACTISCICPAMMSAIPGVPGTHGIPGLPGPVGPKGEEGSKGSKGDPGPQGDRGSEGPTGGPGVGPIGPKGDRGIEGSKGDQGPSGDPGPEGQRGLEGLKGANGDTGQPGPSGAQCAKETEGSPVVETERDDPTDVPKAPVERGDKGTVISGSPGRQGSDTRSTSPVKLAFTATRSSSFRADAGGVILFQPDDIITNVGNAFDGDTGVFTSTREGVFYFSFTVCRFAAIRDVGVSLVHGGAVVVSVMGGALNGQSDQATNSAALVLEVGDRVWLEVVTDQSTLFSNDKRYTSFTGFML